MPMDKPAEIIDRDEDWEKLTACWNDERAHLILMHGRRRVGKSWLLHRFTDAVDGFYYQATRGTRREQIRRLTSSLGEHFDDPGLRYGTGFDDWESLFEYLTDRIGDRRFFFAIDEFPYLSKESPELTSVLQTMWDHRWRDRRMKILLCGSHITLMKQLEGRDQPLHGRRTARITVSPFIYSDVAEFVPDYDALSRLKTYGIFGGLPGHLDRLDPTDSLKANVVRLILDPSSRLYDEATHLLDGFGKQADVHYSTLDAIGGGAHTWGEITKRVERSSGAMWPIIEWLQQMELVRREVPVTKDRPRKSKTSTYRITDPYLTFWYRFIQPIYSGGYVGMASPDLLWRERIEPGLDDYMGLIFEDACRDFVRTRLEFSFEPLRIGRWWTRNSDGEVDVVVRGVDDELFVAECKWGAVDGHDLQTLKRRGQKVADQLGDVSRIEHALFSAKGRIDRIVREAADTGDVAVYDADDLFE